MAALNNHLMVVGEPNTINVVEVESGATKAIIQIEGGPCRMIFGEYDRAADTDNDGTGLPAQAYKVGFDENGDQVERDGYDTTYYHRAKDIGFLLTPHTNPNTTIHQFNVTGMTFLTFFVGSYSSSIIQIQYTD